MFNKKQEKVNGPSLKQKEGLLAYEGKLSSTSNNRKSESGGDCGSGVKLQSVAERRSRKGATLLPARS